MNSYLQTLFYLPLVRSAVYNIPINAEQMQSFVTANEAPLNHGTSTAASALLSLPSSAASSSSSTVSLSARSPSPMSSSVDPSMTTIAAALQMLMYQMQTSFKAIGTKSLTASFGWDSVQSFQQHDVRTHNRIINRRQETRMMMLSF